MKLNINIISIIITAVIGAAIGFLGGPVGMLLPWAIVGLVIGWLSTGLRSAMVNGAIYGFVLSFVFMLHGYKGSEPVSSHLSGFIALSAFGAFCGALLALVSHLAQNRLTKTGKSKV